MDRRRFAQASLLGLAATAQGAGTGARQPPPFRLIYSNDTTHITSNRNPWRNPADGFTDEHLRASIREAAGADAHFLQPGLGWIPWWQSRLYSPREHYEGFLEKYGPVKPHAVGRYLLGGGDLLATLVDECRLLGVAPVLSLRLGKGLSGARAGGAAVAQRTAFRGRTGRDGAAASRLASACPPVGACGHCSSKERATHSKRPSSTSQAPRAASSLFIRRRDSGQ
jgi:hypothetical protein